MNGARSGEPAEKSPAKRRGIGLVVSSPSGAGKTTLSKRLAALDSGVSISISVTTRPPRKDEREGVDYRFVTEQRFAEMNNRGALLEHAEVFGQRYGTPGGPVRRWLEAGQDVVFDIDWQGAGQLREAMGDDLVSVFILPPSLEILRERLIHRAQDSDASVTHRMTRAFSEMSHWNEYDYVLINNDLEDAYRALAGILDAARCARHRQQWVEGFLERFDMGDV